jgi:hypothetical protein
MVTKAAAPSPTKPTAEPRPAAKRARRQAPTQAKAPAAGAVKPAKAKRSAGPEATAAERGSKEAQGKVRVKLVRDSFTMPADDFALIARLKQAAVEAKRETKKSELLRAGLHALASLDAKALVAALNALEPIKVGRPKKGH